MVSASQRLYEKRRAKGLTIEEAAKATKIRPAFLSAIERGEYEKLPKGTYAQGFVANYAEYLGLPKKELAALFRREYNAEKSFTVLPESLSKKKEVSIKKWRLHQGIPFAIGTFLLLIAYLGFQYRHVFLNPTLTVDTPKENAVSKSQSITVTGKTDPTNTVSVNNTPVSLDQDGTFKKMIDVFPGKTIINIKAVNPSGKETIIERPVEIK